jgi:hypothetical protein
MVPLFSVINNLPELSPHPVMSTGCDRPGPDRTTGVKFSVGCEKATAEERKKLSNNGVFIVADVFLCKQDIR